MAIQYVGGRGAGRAGATSTVNVAINSGLSGGIGSAAIAGDLVIVSVTVGSQARNPSCAVSGYTALTQQNRTPTTYDTSHRVSYKFMPTTPDTAVTIPSTGNIADGQGYTIHVFRGVDPTTPLDGVTPTYALGSGTNNRPDPAAIQPASAGAWIYCAGGGAASTGTTVFTAAYLSGFLSYNGPDTNDGTAGAGYYGGWSSGSYDPAVWSGGSVNAANSWCATTLVLRPAIVNYELDATGIGVAPATSSSALTQNHILNATSVASGISTVGAPALTQQANHSLNAEGIIAGAAALGVPGVGQDYIFVAELISLTPGVGAPGIGQAHILIGDGIGTIPAMGMPALGQNHEFVINELAMLPNMGQPAMAQNQILEGENISAGFPILGTPGMGGANHELIAEGCSLEFIVDEPQIGQNHIFATQNIDMQSISDEPMFFQMHSLLGNGIDLNIIPGTSHIIVPGPSRIKRKYQRQTTKISLRRTRRNKLRMVR